MLSTEYLSSSPTPTILNGTDSIISNYSFGQATFSVAFWLRADTGFTPSNATTTLFRVHHNSSNCCESGTRQPAVTLTTAYKIRGSVILNNGDEVYVETEELTPSHFWYHISVGVSTSEITICWTVFAAAGLDPT